MVVRQLSLTILLIMFLVTSLAQELSSSDLELKCSNSTSTSSAFQRNLRIKVMELQVLSRNKPFNNSIQFSEPFKPILYASYLCRGDINATRCHNCVSRASEAAVSSCSSRSTEAVVWGDVCMFRYSDQSFYGNYDRSPPVVHRNETRGVTSVNVTAFDDALNEIGLNISGQLVSTSQYGLKFATMVANVSSGSIYALGECTWDLNPPECSNCVHSCMADLIPTSGKVGGRAMSPTCSFRYETYPFYGQPVHQYDTDPVPASTRTDPRNKKPVGSPQPNLTFPKPRLGNLSPTGQYEDPPKERRASHVEKASFEATFAAIMLLIFCAVFFVYKTKRKNKQDSRGMEEVTNADSLQFELSKIRAATHNFAVDKKLGQGGFGEVYKGKLEKGQNIAVKRLSRDSKQGITEFKTEILLVANLQHKNLVKLLGFCLSGKEKILVYEYLANSSLDRMLFDPIKREALNWETRFSIIAGIAKGMLYLHEDSRLKIIHRDLKTSNILLDDFMNPKISDFGMAKLFGVDQTQDATNTIVGTYGYMAPEYLLTGQYSVKSDIYSFGIILLEMVTGLRNNYMTRPLLEEALLHRAWRLWNEGSAFELVDYVLGDAYSREEVLKCIHIALLCIQEDAVQRPKMTWVVAAIRDETNHFPAPSPPNFFNSIRRSGSGSCSSADPGATSSTAGETLTDLHGR